MHVLIYAPYKEPTTKLLKHIAKLSIQPERLETVSNEKAFKKYIDQEEAPHLIFNLCGDQIEDIYALYSKQSISSMLVFIANTDRHISSAFLFNTLHFLSGDYSMADIKFCFDKYRNFHQDPSEIRYINDLQKLTKLLSQREKEYKKRFMVKIGNVIRSVNVQEIAYIFSHERINYLVKYNGKKFPIDNTLDEVEEMLDPEDFFRANRQFIIHIDSIAEIHPYFKGRVKLNLEPTQEGDLIISAEKSRSFKDWLDE